MPTDIWIDADRSFQCVGCRCVLYTWDAVPVSLTEIRRNPFNYPPRAGTCFSITTLSLLSHLSDSLLPLSPHPSIFFSPLALLRSSLPLHRAHCPLRFLNYYFRLLISCPIAPYRPSSHTLHIPRPCFYLSSSQKISWQQIQKSFCLKCRKVIQKHLKVFRIHDATD